MDSTNPFEAPEVGLSEAPPQEQHYGNASAGQRLLNLAIDYVGCVIFSFFLAVGGVIVIGETALDDVPDTLFGVAVMFLYYLILEGTSGRTLGKLITGTKVISDRGDRPGFLRTAGRTVIRFIPFEPFSFLSSDPIGWHDEWSGTRVVRLRPNKWQRAEQDL